MSAYVVEKCHVNAMLLSALHCSYRESLSWHYNGGWKKLTDANAATVGQMLLDENIKSVSDRYEDSELTNLPGRTDADYILPFEFKYIHNIPNALQTISITRCYMYQACEHDEWETSEAKTFCDALISAKIHQLPGYDDAPWNWNDPEYETSNLIRLA